MVLVLVILIKSKNDKKHKIAPKKRKGGKIVAYAVMRFQKYKISDLGKIERHNNDRSHLKSRVHPELEYLNRTAKHKTKTLTQQIREKIKQIKTEKGKTTRKDAAVVAEFVLTFSPEKTEDIMARRKEWLSTNRSWLVNEFESKGAKILRMDFHCDETTPHIHAFVQMTDERDLFSASRYFGKRQQVEDLQTSYAKAMEKFGLERGISKKITRACNISLDEHRKEVANGVEKLRETADKINEKQAELNKLLQQKENELEEIFKEDNKDNAGYFESKKAEDILR